MRASFLDPMRLIRFLALLMMAGALASCGTTGPDALSVATPPPLASEKYAAIVVDGNTGRMLYQANATAPRFPASLTKMMTLYMLYEAIDSGRLSMSSEIPVSAHAASQAPSKLGLKRGTTIDVRSAVNALSVKSANDVAAAVGEYLGGSEERFAALMTAKARSIGMSSTVFRNASGLPDDRQHTTARDMAVLGIALRKRFPQYYGNFSQRSFAFRGRTVTGHNRTLLIDGVDGIKTGYIRASGFNIVTSVGRRGKRLVIVVMGGKSARERDAHVAELIERFLPAGTVRGAPAVANVPAIAPPATQPVSTQPLDEEDLPGVQPPGSTPVDAGTPVAGTAVDPAATNEMGDGFDAAE